MIVPKGKIQQLATAVEQMQDRAELAREDVKAAMDAVGHAGLTKAAFKSVLKLRKLPPQKLGAWLRTFDAVRDALGLDAQGDLEDAIEATGKLDALAAEDGGAALKAETDATIVDFGKGKAIPKARGRARTRLN